MLRFEGVRLRQGDFALAVDASVARATAVMGPSGAGKSTLLAAIAGFVAPASGRITWDGTDLGPLPPGARPLSILFQDNNLFPHLDVAANLGLGLRPDLRLSRDERARLDAALARVGLEGYGPRLPGTLSGGEQGRVALARALLRARPLMLLDEPFSALGPALRHEMLDLVVEIAAETGALPVMVTHDPGDAARLGGDLMLLHDGVADAPRPVAEALEAPTGPLAAYLGPGT